MTEGAEPESRPAPVTLFMIAFVVLAAGVQALWMALLIWLAIRAFL
jgi:hypothetical protein